MLALAWLGYGHKFGHRRIAPNYTGHSVKCTAVHQNSKSYKIRASTNLDSIGSERYFQNIVTFSPPQSTGRLLQTQTHTNLWEDDSAVRRIHGSLIEPVQIFAFFATSRHRGTDCHITTPKQIVIKRKVNNTNSGFESRSGRHFKFQQLLVGVVGLSFELSIIDTSRLLSLSSSRPPCAWEREKNNNPDRFKFS